MIPLSRIFFELPQNRAPYLFFFWSLVYTTELRLFNPLNMEKVPGLRAF